MGGDKALRLQCQTEAWPSCFSPSRLHQRETRAPGPPLLRASQPSLGVPGFRPGILESARSQFGFWCDHQLAGDKSLNLTEFQFQPLFNEMVKEDPPAPSRGSRG